MRLNAPITALLALAALFFLPVSVLAKSTHHRASKSVAVKRSARHEIRRRIALKPVRETRSSKRNSVTRTMITRTRQPRARELRVREQHISAHDRHRHRSSRETVTATQIARESIRSTSNIASQKATSADFLKAATAPPVQPATEIHGTSHPAEMNEAPSSSATSHRPASTSVPVVSVIRPTAQRPQLSSIEQAASTPLILPTLYNKRGRLIVPPALKGSHEILIRQNLMADHDGLRRIQNDEDLLDMRNRGLLIALPVSNVLEVDDRLPTNRRFCRLWTAQFLATLARAHYAHFHTTLQVNSAVRTVEFQQHLMHINGNAAPSEGDTASPHLTGQAIDIAKHGLSLTEIAWMRGYLLPLVQEGKIDVEEEFQQSCFHISVYRRYLPSATAPRSNMASSHSSETSTLAAAMR
jgi:hypothetical protein